MSDQTSPALITVLLTEEEHEALVWAWYLADAVSTGETRPSRSALEKLETAIDEWYEAAADAC